MSKSKANIKPSKPIWWKKAIPAVGSSCICCDTTTEILNLNTKLYFDFGGWTINKNGQPFFSDQRSVDFDEYKDLNHVEALIGEDDENEYTAEVYLPLRSAKYQRHAKNIWVLIEKGNGFA